MPIAQGPMFNDGQYAVLGKFLVECLMLDNALDYMASERLAIDPQKWGRKTLGPKVEALAHVLGADRGEMFVARLCKMVEVRNRLAHDLPVESAEIHRWGAGFDDEDVTVSLRYERAGVDFDEIHRWILEARRLRAMLTNPAMDL